MTQPSAPIALAYATQHATLTTRQILVRWEKYRILYNGILTLLVLGLAGLMHASLLMDAQFWDMCLGGAIAANVCYCLGPYVDFWLHEWQPQQIWTTVTLFVLGMVFSVAVTLVATIVVIVDSFPKR